MNKNILESVVRNLLEAADVKYTLLNQAETISKIAEEIIRTLKKGNKIILVGNGGSAADAQHITAELSGKFMSKSRKSLPAIALTTNTSILTAIANDFGYDSVFSRQLEGLCNKGDLVIAISTSGNSPSILQAVKKARALGARTIGFTGLTSNRLKKMVHIAFCAPSKSTPRIQECHITAGHIICDLVDKAF
jgi:D-sedoheptulose 7-phosphate isomerase